MWRAISSARIVALESFPLLTIYSPDYQLPTHRPGFQLRSSYASTPLVCATEGSEVRRSWACRSTSKDCTDNYEAQLEQQYHISFQQQRCRRLPYQVRGRSTHQHCFSALHRAVSRHRACDRATKAQAYHCRAGCAGFQAAGRSRGLRGGQRDSGWRV
ncbi:hypothetical protein BCV69DRAFT_35880 [Microstroma glucosiphilum]|uniref:Uncharacterized protein n=1 Tax=Pseudomicrostroma glucosiphilum TaxID=1684307 RepID=A0A316U3N2_9BASI|nr:hypothetical protein BCV69DRAFT_35880 [Pseudomicrostroma glucosiphilum]PWN19847.1 hypothetical protein BCV69DRAFT_35880 [Pseudomicrostroma glucosiphilum]